MHAYIPRSEAAAKRSDGLPVKRRLICCKSRSTASLYRSVRYTSSRLLNQLLMHVFNLVQSIFHIRFISHNLRQFIFILVPPSPSIRRILCSYGKVDNLPVPQIFSPYTLLVRCQTDCFTNSISLIVPVLFRLV